MNKVVFGFIILCCACLSKNLNAQDKWLGTKTPYHPLQTIYTQPPKGYKPVFVNHVGRHGSRFLTKPGSDVIVLNTLTLADEKNALTAKGKRFKKMAALFENIEKGSYENITLSGYDEQQGIGSRMNKRYSNVFKGNGLDVQMTYKVRTQQSADGFLKDFKNYPSGKIQRFVAPDTADDALRFYDISPAYIAYSNSKALKQREDSLLNDSQMDQVAENICDRLFTSAFTHELSTGIEITLNGKKKNIDAIAFVQSLYDIYSMQFMVQKELRKQQLDKTSLDFGGAFQQEDLQWLDKVNNAADFFEKGPGSDTMGIQVIIAVPLLVDFINIIDSIIDGTKKADAKLRFTHAEAISPFATLLGIPQASVPAGSVYIYDKTWNASGIIPMSANIQWILYSNGKGYLIKMLLNEKEVTFPVSTKYYPYYNWQQVKSFYVKKLSWLNVDLKDNMHQYLLQVK